MPMTERSRAVLFRGLSAVVHDEEAVGQLLASIPHDPDELATKDFVRAEIASVHTAIEKGINRAIVWNVGYSTTLAGLILAAVRFG